MRIDVILQNFIAGKIGEIVITDTDWNMIYHTGGLNIDSDRWEQLRNRFPIEDTDGMDTEWEIADKENDAFFCAHSIEVVDEGDHCLVHYLFDITDYAGLFRDLSLYSREWRTLSSCQTDLINSLSGDCSGCLPIAVNYFLSDSAVLYHERNNTLTRYICDRDTEQISCEKSSSKMPEINTAPGAEVSLPGLEGVYLCCATGTTVSGDTYGLYVQKTDEEDVVGFAIYYNVFKLYIENALLRERIIYENEHDHLTGLFNKSKLDELYKTLFKKCEYISVFNLDLNYLKRTNDTLGHDAGNRLLIKAADSLKAVAAKDVYTFRIGGDEFLMIALEADQAKAAEIHKAWQESLDRLNKDDPELECVIACGIATAKAPYDLRLVFEKADELMYENKRAIKLARGDDPDAR